MKFLTDAQTNQRLVELLRKLGWHVETVYQHNLDEEPDDSRVLREARNNGLVFVTFDELRAESGKKVALELKDQGGKMIQVAGGPEQPPTRAAGKLLFHYTEWYPFLSKNDGRVNIADLKQSCRLISRAKMLGRVETVAQLNFEDYLEKRQRARIAPRKKRRRQPPPTEQARMNLRKKRAR